jgi:hypothetical protein
MYGVNGTHTSFIEKLNRGVNGIPFHVDRKVV